LVSNRSHFARPHRAMYYLAGWGIRISV
jgi:hypothetical protein